MQGTTIWLDCKQATTRSGDSNVVPFADENAPLAFLSFSA
jgi:hypothetical protein